MSAKKKLSQKVTRAKSRRAFLEPRRLGKQRNRLREAFAAR